MPKDVGGNPWYFDAATQAEGSFGTTYNLWGTISAAANATEQLTVTAHNLATGNGPVRLTGADLPLGLSTGVDYWVIRVDANTIQVASSETNANDSTAVAFSDDGSGAMTLTMKSVFNHPFYLRRLKIDTGNGGDVLIEESSGGRDILKADNTPANDTLNWEIDGFVSSFYITTLPTNALITVWHGPAVTL